MTITRLDHVGVVVDDLDAAGEIAQYEDVHRICDLRGPEGIIVALAEEL